MYVAILGFKSWQKLRTEEAQKLCTQRVLRSGPVQYSDVGSGYPVLYIHGSLGGCDSGPILFKKVIRNGFRFISPSRPGFLQSNLGQTRTPLKQAQLYKELLESLKIRKTAVIAHSGGAPSAIAFVSKHPEMASSLVLYAAVSHKWNRKLTFMEKIFMHDFPLWILYLFSHIFPSLSHRILCNILAVPYERTKKSPEAVRFLDWMMDSLMPIRLRMPGLQNDLKQFSTLENPEYSGIKCPVYVFHGTHDRDLPLSFSVYVAEHLAREKFFLLDGGHEPAFFVSGNNKVLKEIVGFIRTYAV